MDKKGTVSLTIDDSGLKAFLVFNPDESAEVCTADQVKELLKKSLQHLLNS